MKFCKTTYLSLFFLFCFTASFGFNTVQSFRTSVHKADLSHGKSSAVSTQEESSASGSYIWLEKNEDENEKSLSIQAFLLPFYISFFQSGALQSPSCSAGRLAERHPAPIYIAVCNFRI